ncbi:hypothetical protein AVEN_2869-1 [Araneus ventricosus]|uniref:Uncharacterized protein n=1 Tax=Araneus ventricosus TaxID=182803 RepID=A0A4Y2EH51_ARAVE|nr:hypothetical protein AVEN_2869-1 [Araneus ventricosus]
MERRNQSGFFKTVIHNFLGDSKADIYDILFDGMSLAFCELGCSVNLKLHFLSSKLDQFPMFGVRSNEQREGMNKAFIEISTQEKGAAKATTRRVMAY